MVTEKDFDAVAATWDEEPRRVRLAADIAAGIRRNVPLNPAWDGLDFGCGTGLVTLQLAPLVRSVVGADSSAGMLDRLAAKVKAGLAANVRTMAAAELPVRTPAFDLVVSAMTLHHVADAAVLLERLAGLLRPGGYLAVADLDREDGSFHDDATGVFHHGFSRDEFERFFVQAGLLDISVDRVAEVRKGERVYPVLLACGRRTG